MLLVLFNTMMVLLELENKQLQMTTFKEFSTLFKLQTLFMLNSYHNLLKLLVFLLKVTGNGVKDKMVHGKIVLLLLIQLII